MPLYPAHFQRAACSFFRGFFQRQSGFDVTVQTHLKREVFFAAFREKPEYNDENPIA